MPNPKANRPITKESLLEDFKSFRRPSYALADTLAGAGKGAVVGTAGAFGDLRDINDLLADDEIRKALEAKLGKTGKYIGAGARGIKDLLGERVMPTSQEVSDMLPDVVPKNNSERKHSAEFGQAFGELGGIPNAGAIASKGVKAGAKLAGKELARGMYGNEGSFARVIPESMKPAYVVRPTGGGQALPMTKQIQGLKGTPNGFASHGQSAEQIMQAVKTHPHMQEWFDKLHPQQRQTLEHDSAIDAWIGNTFGNYAKKRMATPEDEIRQLASQGIHHMGDRAWHTGTIANVNRQIMFNRIKTKVLEL